MPVKIVLLALLLTVITVAIHSLGTHVALTYRAVVLRRHLRRPWARMVGLMALLVTFLLMVHLVEAGVWALAYFWFGMFPDLSTSGYYSLTSYSTVGFGDVVLPVSSRVLGPIESVVGVLMLGWSTAVIVAIVQKTYRKAAERLGPSRRD